MPAIDILDGKVVRLHQGDFAQRTDYGVVQQALEFFMQWAMAIHVVDLDGAKSGKPVNRDIILGMAEQLRREGARFSRTPEDGLRPYFDIDLQVSGGIRTYEDAKRYLEAPKIKRVILGTAAIEDPELLQRLLHDYGHEQVAVAVDIKDGKVATRGWLAKGAQTAADVLPQLKKMGVTTVMVTDISRDGTLAGANLELPRKFIDAGFKTIVAGGVTSLNDIRALHRLGAYAAVAGKAIYERQLDLRDAMNTGITRSGLTKRIIPCMDVKDGRVVKGTHFKDLRDAGDPVELGKRYSDAGADELVFLDISATLERRKTLAKLVARIAREINIPFTVGGGISSVADMEKLLRDGADKVSVGSAALQNPRLIEEASANFGAQCIVISVDAKRDGSGWKVYIKGGTEPTDADALEFSKRMEQLGAGELLVNSLDRDGTKQGFDVDLLKAITESVGIPVIASSGAGSAEHFLEVFERGGVDAALGASVFHYGELELGELKRYLTQSGLPIRI